MSRGLDYWTAGADCSSAPKLCCHRHLLCHHLSSPTHAIPEGSQFKGPPPLPSPLPAGPPSPPPCGRQRANSLHRLDMVSRVARPLIGENWWSLHGHRAMAVWAEEVLGITHARWTDRPRNLQCHSAGVNDICCVYPAPCPLTNHARAWQHVAEWDESGRRRIIIPPANDQ